MKAGDLVLVQGAGFIERSIQLVERGAFDHVAIAVSDTHVIEAVPHGVVLSPIHYTRYAVYECVGITDEQRLKAVDFAHSKLGTEYNFLQDISYFLEFAGIHVDSNFWNKHGKVICSSLVDLSLRSTGFVLREDRKSGNITPMGCIFTPKVRLIENHSLWEV